MILVFLLLIPFAAGLVCWQITRTDEESETPRWVALLSMVVMLLICLWLWLVGDYGLSNLVNSGAPQWQTEFQANWIPRFGISVHLAMDGLALIMVALTSFLGILAVLCSWKEITNRVGFFHLNLMWVIGGVTGVFLSIDLFLFFFFWEMMLVPMYFLIALWGHSGSAHNTRIAAAIKFFIYTQMSGLIMLSAILGLAFAHYFATGQFSFDYEVLLQSPVGGIYGYVLMLGFFIAFAVKLPVVPFHGWLPDAHAQAPTAGSVDLAGILLKTGAYGMLRFALPLFPEASMHFAPVPMVLGLVGIYYGAALAFAQKDLKRLIACSSIAHMGFVLIGIYSGSAIALQGVVMLMVAHAFSSCGLFIMSGQLYERIHTRDMSQMGGLFGRLGALPGFGLAFVMASLGMPGTANFIGEFLILFGTFPAFPWVIAFATGGLILAAVYSLILMHRVYWGPVRETTGTQSLFGMDSREYLMLMFTLGLSIVVGFYPQVILDISDITMNQIASWVAAVAPSAL